MHKQSVDNQRGERGAAVNERGNGSNSNRIQAGSIGSYLAERTRASDDIDDTDLIGHVPTATINNNNNKEALTLQSISSFLLRHRLAETETIAAYTASNSSTIDNNDTNAATTTTAAYYLPTMMEFEKAQWERQAAGLRSNTNQESSAGLVTLVESHHIALQRACCLANLDTLLSKEMLCEIHEILCYPKPHAGKFRTTPVRAGTTFFCAPDQLETELTHFFQSVKGLQTKWSIHNNTNADTSRVYHAIALAALVLYGICDIHPFRDGNGRLARIYANAILKSQLQLPFTITLVATPQQRHEYVQGLRRGHMLLNVSQNSRPHEPPTPLPGNNNDNNDNQNTSEGALKPLIAMLLERIGCAMTQAQSLLDTKARFAQDENEARILRLARERTANEGQCIICLENNPNIATLCCGQAVHLNCMAEWLANSGATASSCVNCRSPLPRMNRPAAAAATAGGGGVPAILDPAFLELYRNVMQRLTTTEADTTYSTDFPGDDDATTTAADETEGPPQCPHCNNRAALDCGNAMCGRCCGQHGQAHCARHGHLHGTATEDTTTADTTTEAEYLANNNATEYTTTEDTTTNNTAASPVYCLHCGRNRAAMDCQNTMCGRCCVLSGNAHCVRHNTW